MPPSAIETAGIRALVFDFDGVIIDTESSDLRAWREVFEEHGAELTLAVWAQVIGTQEHHFDPIQHLELLLGMPVDRAGVAASHARRTLELTEALLATRFASRFENVVLLLPQNI